MVVHDNGGTANGGVDSVTNTFTVTVNPVNEPPSFTMGANQTVLEDAAAQSVANWATAISAGPPDESGQTLTFHASNNNNGLFSVQPAISASGTLTYTPATNANGSATVTVYLQDSGGTANGGNDTSATNTFTITVTPVNDPPSFSLLTNNVAVQENGGAQSIPLATNISPGPANESSQTVAFLVGNNSNSLFSAQPAISANGTLTFTPAANANGTATVTVYAQDNGGTANGGVDTSAAQTFAITITPVNQPPTLDAISNLTTNENSGLQTVNLSGITPGPANESSQTVTITATSGNPSVVPNPTVNYTSPDATGTLTFTPVTNVFGTATITVVVYDNGGTANGGVDSVTNTFTVTINIVLAAIAGSVKLDVNGNGVADANDTNGISPVVIKVYQGGTNLVATVTNSANGMFCVTNLPQGDYSVAQTVPAGYTATTPVTVNVTLTSGSTGTANYLDTQPVTIGDFVWVDTNGNGVQDAGESGLAGVTVVLYRTNSSLGTLTAVATNISSSSGAYSFTGVAPGDFVVGFYPPAGWNHTVAHAGPARNLDSDAGMNGLTAVFSLAPGQTDLSIDAGFWQGATIGNQVWDDANNDGWINPGEVGFDGVTVELWRDLNNDGVFDPTGADAQTPVTTVTAGGGFYSFTGVAPGQYFVNIPTPPAYHTLSSTHTTTVNNHVDNCDKGIQAGGPGTPTISPPVTVASGETNNTIDFGFVDPGVGNLVWLDLNQNGRVDPGEPGLSNVIVNLYDSNNVQVATTTTDENGYYLFEALPPDSYFVKVSAANFLPGGALANYRAATPIVATNANDHVDDDSNGMQTEPGAEVTSSLVTLRSGQEPTDADTETGRGNFLDNGADADGDMTVDFGFTGTGFIGDRVWVDTNANGLQDAGEPGLAGVTVILYRTNSSLGTLTAIATNVTTSTGAYGFAYLCDGDYVVGFSLPDG